MRAEPMIFHDVEFCAARLMGQAADLAVAGRTDLPPEAAGPEHRSLLRGYVRDLGVAADIAVGWWNALVTRAMEGGLGEAEAIRSQYEQRPAGPATRPEVVFVVRDYWLRVTALNERSGAEAAVAPQTFLLAWLAAGGFPALHQMLSAMPCWPIGLDENGRWC